MPFSAVVVNRVWDAAVDQELRPARHPDVAEVFVDGMAVITHPHAEAALALDPVSSVLWQAFDGETPLGELAADLADSLAIPAEEADRQVEGMVRWLGWRGFLVEPYVYEALRHDAFPVLTSDDCPAKKMGLVDADLIDLEIGSSLIRVGATDPEIVDWLAARFAVHAVAPDAADEREIVCANVGVAQGSVRPRHRVIDHAGRLVYQSRERDAVAVALARYVEDRLDQADHPVAGWFRTPMLVGDGRAALVHREHVRFVEPALPRLEREGIRLYESPYVLLDAGSTSVVVPESTADFLGARPETPPGRLALQATLGADADLPAYESVRAFSELAVRWDQTNLERTRDLVEAVPMGAFDPEAPATEIARVCRAALVGS
jgi:hypothetical protein